MRPGPSSLTLDIGFPIFRAPREKPAAPGQAVIRPCGPGLSLPARMSIASALEASIDLRHNYLGCEHLLLGLIKLGQGVAVNVLQKMGVDTKRFSYERIPTIYHVNLRDPSGMLLAAGFQMHTKDVMYVANARVVDYYKLLTLINNTANTVSNTSAAVTSVNAATKTRW